MVAHTMRTAFTLLSWTAFVAVFVFGGFGFWIAFSGQPVIGVLVLFCAACCGFLGEGFRLAATKEALAVRLPPHER